MTMRRFSVFILTIAFPFSFTIAASSDCDSDSDTQFVCGPVSPEDLVPIPDTPWIIVSSMEEEGYISVVNSENHSATVVFPSAAAAIEFDSEIYPDCPNPPSSQFQPHGLSLLNGTDGRQNLYVVAHGERESVEVFDVDSTAAVPKLTWVGCVIAPSGVGLNSVAALPDGGFTATNFNIAAGNLWEWHSGNGWVEVPGSQMPGPNGLVVSSDGRWYYIGGWAEKSVVRLSRGQTPVIRESVEVGFHVDNVRWTTDGSLLAAGQFSETMAAVGGCLNGSGCAGVSTRVARIDIDTLTAQQLLDYPSNDILILGTVAIEVGEEIWVGAIAGGNKIGRFPL
ncbi:MAG: hypothetical protein ACI80L_000621 [Pseudohongiellaceae bacterium]|jgi:hypothetical protein